MQSDNHSLGAFTGQQQPTDSPETSSDTADDSDAYGTPRSFIRRFHDAIGGRFALDPAAGAEPVPIAETRFDEADDGLVQSWQGYESIYLNPPYSDPYPWLAKLAGLFATRTDEGPEFALALTRTDTSTGWFHDHLLEGQLFSFLDSRVSFHGEDDDADFANMLTVFGSPPDALVDVLAEMGALCAPVEVESALEQQCLGDIISDGGVAAAPIQVGSPAGPHAGREERTLHVFHSGEQVRIRFTDEGLGARDVPEEVTVRVLPDGKTVDPETGMVTLATAGQTSDGRQVCVDLRNSPRFAGGLEASIAVDDQRWTLATPTIIVPERAHSEPTSSPMTTSP